ncbi:MAG: 30S ribosomal protein S3 [Lentisphaeria bacterium]
MGQKVNPISFRLPVTKDWQSRWFANKADFGDKLHEDLLLREYVEKRLKKAAVSKVKIERFANRVRVTIFTARPGLVIGRKGSDIETLKAQLSKLANGKEVFIDIQEVHAPELDAKLVAKSVAEQLERRVGHRRAMKKAISTAMELGADGIRIRCAGRLGGAELARTEQYKDGKVPLHTIDADVQYGFTEASTLAGLIGVKVWICLPKLTEEEKNAFNAKARKTQKGAAKKPRRKRSK